MFISSIHIEGFRNLNGQKINFNEGVNVILGHNNAGKTNLLKALSLVLDSNSTKRLEIDDFAKNVPIENLKEKPPRVHISITIKQSENEDLNTDDLVTVANWLIKLEPPYEAVLTYEFFLPEKELNRYKKEVENETDKKNLWLTIKHNFLRYYTSKIYGGKLELKYSAESEYLQKFDFQYLNAIRDVERDMFTGRNTLLRDVLDFFIDYEIKSNHNKPETEKYDDLKRKRLEFHQQAKALLQSLRERMEQGKGQILSYAKDTGASFHNAEPDFDGTISEVELYSALRLIIKYEMDIEVPATHNGLGYNNLIFMSLLLAKMQIDSDGNYLGSNARVFPILVIEEPEAHLHPSMQFKFLKFLKENQDVKKKVRQVFITTHSTHITSAVSLDDIVCLHSDGKNLTVGYPGKVFPKVMNGEKEIDSEEKKYVQRFLDATKSDMLFAQKILFVEGITEQLLLPTLAKYCGKSLEDEHVAVINIGGRYFEHFNFLFNSNQEYTIPKKVACLTDRDPERKNLPNGKFKKCYPFQYNHEPDKFEYKNNSAKSIEYNEHPNIRFYSPKDDFGKTFEYDLVFSNPFLEILLTESVSNRDEIKELMTACSSQKELSEILNILRLSEENNFIIEGISSCSWSDDDKKKAIIAARYLNSISKGEHALGLLVQLEDNLISEEKKELIIPSYIKEAIEWICQ